jgi:hypothetical protein
MRVALASFFWLPECQFLPPKKKKKKLIKHWLTWKLELNEKVFSVHPPSTLHIAHSCPCVEGRSEASAWLNNIYFQCKLVKYTSPQSNLYTKTKQFEAPIVGMMHGSTWKHKKLPDELESPIMCFAVAQ